MNNRNFRKTAKRPKGFFFSSTNSTIGTVAKRTIKKIKKKKFFILGETRWSNISCGMQPQYVTR